MSNNEIDNDFLIQQWPTGTRPRLILPFDVIWEKENGKRILLKKAGDPFLLDELQKFIDKGMNLICEKKVHTPWFYTGQTILSQLKIFEEQDTPSPAELQQWRQDALKWMYSFMMEMEDELSYLDFCFLCEQIFGFSDETLKARFIQYPLEVQKKNLVGACFGLYIALGLGYANYNFLKDLFIVFLFFDSSLCNEMWSNSEKEFLVKHWKGEKSGDDLRGNKEKLESFQCTLSGEFAKFIGHRSLLRYLNWSFEDLDGDGLFHQIKQEEMSDIDCLSLLVYHYGFFEGEMGDDIEVALVQSILNKTEEAKVRFVGRRLERLINLSFQESKSNDDDFLEISGL